MNSNHYAKSHNNNKIKLIQDVNFHFNNTIVLFMDSTLPNNGTIIFSSQINYSILSEEINNL